MPEPKQGPASSAPAAEPLAAILADFRKFALRAAEEDRMISPESVLLLADKVEAAAERERAHEIELAKLRAPGNAAAMREALEQAIAYCESDQKSGIAYSDNDVLVPMLRAALAAPARNCDVGTVEKQTERFIKFCEGHLCDNCPNSRTKRCGIGWSQMPFAPAKGSVA